MNPYEKVLFKNLSEEKATAFRDFLKETGLFLTEENVSYGGIALLHKYAFACGWDAAKDYFRQKAEKELERQEKRETYTDWEESNRIGKLNALEDFIDELKKPS